MVLALASYAVLWAVQSFTMLPPSHPLAPLATEQEARRLERAIEHVDAMILSHRYKMGLDIPVVPMAGPVHQAGYRPGDIADGKLEHALQPVAGFAPVEPPTPLQLRVQLAEKWKQLDQLRREYPLPSESR
ncbi:MAG: hypothetical protein LC104_18265 [Bacteroidales bacterium]|nr:hypothetical protein [Bacteroidales bacterium]